MAMNSLRRTLDWFSRPGSLPLILLIYLLLRVAVLAIPLTQFSDGSWYMARASNLAWGEGYTEDGVPTAFWPPGLPMVLSVLFRIFSPSPVVAQIFNLVCSMGTAWLTLDLGRRLFQSEATGRIALLLLAIYPNNIGYLPLVATEVFYTMLLLGGCWLLIARNGNWSLLLAGLVFGFATLTKAQSLLVIPIIFAVGTLREKLTLRRVGAALAKTFAVVLIALLVVSPWSYRNYKIFGEWVMVSTNGGLTLLSGNNPSARGDYTPDDPLMSSIPRTVATQLDVDKEARKRAINWIKENPGRFIALIPSKIFRQWGPDGESEWAYQAGYGQYAEHANWFRLVRYLNQAYYAGLMLAFAATGYLLLSGKARVSSARLDWWLLPYALAIYPLAIAVVFSGQSRFHYPVMPFITMCSAWILVRWIQHPQVDAPRQGGAPQPSR
jgi:4-amino-4-deoxy-L-arabinose transferase-like glycosyltransferase